MLCCCSELSGDDTVDFPDVFRIQVKLDAYWEVNPVTEEDFIRGQMHMFWTHRMAFNKYTGTEQMEHV